MIETKTKKTPLMMSEAFGPSCWSFIHVLENKFSHGTQSQYGLVPKLRHHGGKNNGSVEPEKHEMFKPHGNSILCFSAERSEAVFSPLMMFSVAKQRGLMAGLVRELAHRHQAMTTARRSKSEKHQQRGF